MTLHTAEQAGSAVAFYPTAASTGGNLVVGQWQPALAHRYWLADRQRAVQDVAMKHQRGFTLLEMLAALTLMAIC
ncbi:prepilin-type N-terminal cleavage/methylation domain-containing protein, partial [Pseudomonas lactucae]|uniref:prepilin-type N-terminal cleavage/methylation domain-containing protein n=1 Tax=Pseudomonas lactucae TaxID=2813360 RepID=UPI0031345FBA